MAIQEEAQVTGLGQLGSYSVDRSGRVPHLWRTATLQCPGQGGTVRRLRSGATLALFALGNTATNTGTSAKEGLTEY